MSYLPPEEEQVLILSTKKPMSRWLRMLLKILAALLAAALIFAGVIGWRYYAVHRRLKKDLTTVIRTEEHLRSLGGINAAADLIAPNAPDSWRFRYLSSIRARKGRPEPEIRVQSVGYDGVNARVAVDVDGVRQFRHYQLYAGTGWRRAPFIANGWGYKHAIENAGGFKIIYWDEDEAFARTLAADLPALVQQMHDTGLTPASANLAIIPREFDDLARPARAMDGIVLNSPHVDLIPETSAELSPRQMLRLALADEIVAEARKQALVSSDLPGAARVQRAIDDVLIWQWAAGEIPVDVIAAWGQELKGHWASPVTGLPPNLITELPPDAPDAAARLMMTWLLRKEGPDALFALSASLPDARTWDEAYDQAAGKTAAQVEQAARELALHPGAALPDWPAVSALTPPQTLTLLTTTPDASGRLLARTAAGDVVLLQPQPDAAFTLADGSALDYDCVAPGSQVAVRGNWLDEGLRLSYDAMTLKQAALPPILRISPMGPAAVAMAWRYSQDEHGDVSQISLVQLLPDAGVSVIAYPGVRPIALPAPGAPPLLVWQQSVRCNRDWIVAYAPEQGVVGSWLAPASAERLVYADRLPGENLKLLLAFDPQPYSFYQSDQNHALRLLSDEESQALVSSIPVWRTPFINTETQTVQIFDPVAQETIQLYQPPENEEPMAIIPAFGWPEDVFFFTMRQRHKPLAPVKVMKISTRTPGEATPVFQISPVGDITSMARCPDGSYLYGLTIYTTTVEQGSLRWSATTGEDVALTAPAEGLLAPVTCVRTPTRGR